MTEDRKSRAFIIGDKEHGLTIVITDPVMVLHYSKEDLGKATYSDMSGKEPRLALAGIAQELIQYFRTDINEMDSVERDFRSGKTPYTLEELESLLAERNNAAAIGRTINSGGAVHDVDFCLAIVIDPSEIALRRRSVGPASQIQEYIEKYKDGQHVPASSQRFPISNLNTDNLGPLEAWKPKGGEA
jgi:hypothetical protein